jgi:putative tryptophan/tyrosine transport system substrate-binding protein
MKRREFITLFAGVTAAWPLAARAQQSERVRRIGVLMNRAANDREGQARLAAFQQGLQQTGWSIGRNAQIDLRWGEDDLNLESKYAAELVALRVRQITRCIIPGLRSATEYKHLMPRRPRS